MIRKRFRKPPTAISLFPFLAVLICTMGAMILLLVMGVQQAHVQANIVGEQNTEAEAARLQEIARLKQTAEDAQWQYKLLQPKRDEKLKELSEQEARMRHLESHIRELEEKWRVVQEQIRKLEAKAASKNEDQGTLAAQLESARAQLKLLRKQVEEAKQELAHQSRSYRIIPYDGPNGTQRRPIYVECTAEGIILQPEGVVIGERDFLGPAGPGNPLATALRAKREYLIRNGLVHQNARPYPLLVVRPGGSTQYALARRAMTNWEDEYGYELVEDDVDLNYPKVDPALPAILRQAIETARQRQSVLAAAQPRLYQQLQKMMQERGGRFQPSQGGANAATRPATRRRANPVVIEGMKPSESKEVKNPYVTNGQGGAPIPEAMKAFGAKPNAVGTPGGKDWGLRGDKATRIPRYARVSCEANRLVLLPNRLEKQQPKVVNVRDKIDAHAFVTAMWEFVDQWGMAYPGATWKPILLVDVAPNGEARFEELKTALKNSGIEVKRKGR